MKTKFAAGIALLLVATSMTFAPANADAPVSVTEESVEVISAPIVELTLETVEVTTSPALVVAEPTEVISTPATFVEPTTPITELTPISTTVAAVEAPVASITPSIEPLAVSVETVEVLATEALPDCTVQNLFTTILGCSNLPEGLTRDSSREEAIIVFSEKYPEFASEASGRYLGSQIADPTLYREGYTYLESSHNSDLVHVFFF